MKNLKIILNAMIVALAVIAFSCSSKRECKFSGVVGDASMNGIMLVNVASGDTMVFSTTDAKIIGPGIMLSDMAEVSYRKSDGEGIDKADQIIIKSLPREDSPLCGRWVESVEVGDTLMVQGIMLDKSGQAQSIGMNTLVYQMWSPYADSVVLTGQSIGNHQTFDFIEVYKAVVSNDSLRLTNGDMEIVYRRE